MTRPNKKPAIPDELKNLIAVVCADAGAGERLFERAAPAEQAELRSFIAACGKTQAAYNKSAASTDKKDWDAARSGLDEAVTRLTVKYFPTRDTAPAHENLFDVVKHLQAQGYKVKKSKVYGDRKRGLIRVQEDGSVLHSDVKMYAALLDRTFGESGDKTGAEITIAKAEQELKLIKLKIARAEHELEEQQGKYILREDFEREMVARAVIIDSVLRQLLRVHSGELVAAAGGDGNRENEFLRKADVIIDQAMNSYATNKTYHLEFAADAGEGN